MKALLIGLLTLGSLSAFAENAKYNCGLSKLENGLATDSINKHLESDGDHFLNDVSFPEFENKYQIQAEATLLDFKDGAEVTVRISKGKISAFNDKGTNVQLQTEDSSFELLCSKL